MRKLKKTILENPRLHKNLNLRFKQAGNTFEIFQSGRKFNQECPFIKINKDIYIKKDNLEVKYFKYSENKSESLESVRQSLQRIRDLINTNVTNPKNCKWITLTFAENMTDTKKLYKCLSLFHKRYNYNYTNEGEEIRYIDCIEPQGRGAFHAHMIIIYDRKAPFVPFEDLEKLWGFGSVDVQNLKNIDNVGAYLTAYLGDMELDKAIDCGLADRESLVKTDEKTNKKYIKGARLHLYPRGMHICRHSRNCEKPVISYKENIDIEVLRLIVNFDPRFKRGFELTDNDGFSFQNVYYNYVIKPSEHWKVKGEDKPSDYVDIVVGEHQLTLEELFPDCFEDYNDYCESLFEKDIRLRAFDA